MMLNLLGINKIICEQEYQLASNQASIPLNIGPVQSYPNCSRKREIKEKQKAAEEEKLAREKRCNARIEVILNTTGYYLTTDRGFDAVENLSKKEYGKKARKEVWKCLPIYKAQGISQVLGISSFRDLEKAMRGNFFKGTIDIWEEELEGLTPEEIEQVRDNLTTWKELLRTEIIPKWILSLTDKKKKEESNKNVDKRRDTVGKKLLRDCREFYRIIWECRYKHVKDKDKIEKTLYKNIFNELGLNEYYGELCLIDYKTFFNRVLNLPPNLKSEYHKRQIKGGPMKVMKGYNVKDRDVFL